VVAGRRRFDLPRRLPNIGEKEQGLRTNGAETLPEERVGCPGGASRADA